MPPRLHLSRRHLGRLRALAEAAWPHEACGLIETAHPGRVRAVHVLRNHHDEPTHRFTIDPEAYLWLERAAGARGHTIGGVWHSHPHGDPQPSPRDREQAWPGWSYLIAGVTTGHMNDLRCWRVGRDGGVAEVPLRLWP